MDDIRKLADDAAAWLRNYAHQAGARGYVVGLSGGVDSAVVASLCQRAVGDEVLAALMPIQSLPEDADYARQVAQAFELRTVEIGLGAAYDALLRALPDGLTDLAQANIKPRLRMIALYALAQQHGYLVAGTGNKSERMVGYFTKWGDGGVDVAPLGDLYKSQVRALARELGVPRPIIDRAPTAGLWRGQTDEGEMGVTYDDLEATLRAMEASDVSSIDPATLARVQGMMAVSAHKRKLPPIFDPTVGEEPE